MKDARNWENGIVIRMAKRNISLFSKLKSVPSFTDPCNKLHHSAAKSRSTVTRARIKLCEGKEFFTGKDCRTFDHDIKISKIHE